MCLILPRSSICVRSYRISQEVEDIAKEPRIFPSKMEKSMILPRNAGSIFDLAKQPKQPRILPENARSTRFCQEVQDLAKKPKIFRETEEV